MMSKMLPIHKLRKLSDTQIDQIICELRGDRLYVPYTTDARASHLLREEEFPSYSLIREGDVYSFKSYDKGLCGNEIDIDEVGKTEGRATAFGYYALCLQQNDF